MWLIIIQTPNDLIPFWTSSKADERIAEFWQHIWNLKQIRMSNNGSLQIAGGNFLFGSILLAVYLSQSRFEFL